MKTHSHRFCVAPMMDWTDRHDRSFLRLFSKRALLYTEMVTSAALIRGKALYLLDYHPQEHPLAIQLGGSDPVELAKAAVLAEQAGFIEVNLNVGCPSDRVQSGSFGACLMNSPALLGDCIKAMQDATSIDITVKCRIGVDAMDSDEQLIDFIGQLAKTGCHTFIIHARIALLSGLSPKQNREIPPLNYPRVFLIKQRFPDLNIVINGGIADLDAAGDLLAKVDGVMIGREAYHNPYMLHRVDHEIFGDELGSLSRLDYLQAYLPYVQMQLAQGVNLQHITRHILGLFKGVAGGKQFRRYLSENAYKKQAGIEVLEAAMAQIQ
ncbi:MAG: tRNA dihydrouridine(20/20a) synthase DusA [SAR86 cluster bacterium]|uniref:tRNA-dihydrouridine(20/20a) synthase n=1 Tax=SAR86 cluster bacterium TaxID=2030880 RepID=A0A2A4MH72_9GAMM|nr:MAG: tRNA dihydrouridine(20/20a) synthase DusA [SAR86 cluster bacterium]